MRVLSVFICFLMATMPVTVYAQEANLSGKVTSLVEGETAPYTGVLLDTVASSKMLVDNKYVKLEIELQLRKEFAKELAEKRLAFDLLKVEYDSLKKIHDETIKIKDEQITMLNDTLRDEISGDYSEWWLTGGVALGIILSVAIFYASVEIAK